MPTNSRVHKYPASCIQEQFWLINRLHPANTAYNIPSLFKLKGPLDSDVIKQSVSEIIRRHDIFRTTFTSENGELHQIVAAEPRFAFSSVLLNDINPGKKEKKLQSLISSEVQSPFDLEQGPLLRVTLFCISDDEHYLLIMMHHIITDLRSKELFSSELSYFYNALIQGKTTDLPSPEQQYKDYSLWQKNWLGSGEYEAMLEHWRKHLSNHSGYLNLPTDHPRQPVQILSGGSMPFHLPQSFSDSLKEFSRQKNVNIFLTLLTAYLILLFRYTVQKDIIIGVPLTNRRQNSHKDFLGCFVNILPLTFTVSNDMTFDEVLRQVRLEMLAAHRNQEMPYEQMVKKLQTKRDPSYNPFFQVGFTFEPPMELEFAGLEITTQKIHNQGTQLDLFLNLWEKEEEVHGFIEYNRELFDDSTLTRFAGHYKTLLQAILTDQDHLISTLPILPKAEKNEISVAWNSTQKELPEKPYLHVLFEEQARRTPDSIAIVFDDSHLTYQELNTRANQLAHHLLDLGVNPGTLVGVYIERSLEMIIALLGILKAGGSYVPLDPNFPQDRLDYMLDDTGLNILLTQENLSSLVAVPDINKIHLDTHWTEIENQPASNPSASLSPDDLAYVIYTSGSTGRPKGVQIPHNAVVNFLLSMSRQPGITEKDALLAVTTLSFDISVLEIFLPLSVGAKIIIASNENAVNGQQLLEIIKQSEVTIMQATPVTWYLLIAAGWKGSDEFKVLCGGEALPQDLAQQLVKRSKNVWNLYGPTETTIWSTCCQVQDDFSEIHVGRPIDNTQVYIVNDQNQLNPIGIAGELLIGGAGVSRGYLNKPDLTKEKFIPDHISKVPNSLLYRTGDLACIQSDGNIKIYSRLDNQIKLRGFRIELGEIESVLVTHSAVDQAVAIIREEAFGDKRIVAYITLQAGQNFSEIDLLQHLKKKLPEYMIPSIFVKMDTMPLTPNGKIDRKSLPHPKIERPELVQEFIQPQNELHKIISRLWSKILKIDKIGINDNFFDLGGDSLLSVQLVTLLEKEMKTEIPVVKFFQYPTIRNFADYIERRRTPQQHSQSKLESRALLQKKALAKRRQLIKS
jgi:amino acid adenylation domain-containing protein